MFRSPPGLDRHVASFFVSSAGPDAIAARARACAWAFARRNFTLSFVGNPDSIARASPRRKAVESRGRIVAFDGYPTKTARLRAWPLARERSARTLASSTERTSLRNTVPASYTPRRSRPTMSGKISRRDGVPRSEEHTSELQSPYDLV